jgi:putative transposase
MMNQALKEVASGCNRGARHIKKSNKYLLQSPAMKYRFIQEHRKEFRLGKVCKVLEVSKSGYHKYVRR